MTLALIPSFLFTPSNAELSFDVSNICRYDTGHVNATTLSTVTHLACKHPKGIVDSSVPDMRMGWNNKACVSVHLFWFQKEPALSLDLCEDLGLGGLPAR